MCVRNRDSEGRIVGGREKMKRVRIRLRKIYRESDREREILSAFLLLLPSI
jgi:hypothetical protein